MLELVSSILSQDAVATALAGLVALLLVALTALVRRQLQRMGLEISAAEEARVREVVEEGILLARQVHRKEDDGDARNTAMHGTAIDHILKTAGQAASKLGMERLNSLVHAGVRRLKSIL